MRTNIHSITTAVKGSRATGPEVLTIGAVEASGGTVEASIRRAEGSIRRV
jgi:hypothetical protein